jgi:hypothetical protein
VAGLLHQNPKNVHAAAQALRNLTFPRTATYYLGQDSFAPCWPCTTSWSSTTSGRTVFRPITSLSSVRSTPLAAVRVRDPVDSMSRLGTVQYWAEQLRPVAVPDSDVEPLPPRLVGPHRAGLPVHEYLDSVMTNLTDGCG